MADLKNKFEKDLICKWKEIGFNFNEAYPESKKDIISRFLYDLESFKKEFEGELYQIDSNTGEFKKVDSNEQKVINKCVLEIEVLTEFDSDFANGLMAAYKIILKMLKGK